MHPHDLLMKSIFIKAKYLLQFFRPNDNVILVRYCLVTGLVDLKDSSQPHHHLVLNDILTLLSYT